VIATTLRKSRTRPDRAARVLKEDLGRDAPFLASIQKIAAGAPPRGLVARAVQRWCSTWGVATLAGSVSIRTNARLRSSIARLVVAERRIELGPLFFSALVNHREVLCHELAHFAAHVKYGRRIRPHGPEWRELVRAAGFKPRVRHPQIPLSRRAAAQRWTRRYEHRCPVCQSVWYALRRMTTWRCAECAAAGLPGHLHIRALDLRTQGALR
jgi:predicted SprT family Zn-dependent metalloprotease